MNVISLCDGMSCGQIALKELGIKVDRYYSSEIYDKAIEVTQANFPDTIQLGDVTHFFPAIVSAKLPKIDLVMFGFPCRSLSRATSGRDEYNNGLKGVSGLFWDCLAVLNWVKQCNNPDVYFLVENVDTAKKDDIKEISRELGCDPIMLNSADFSAQERKRNYWTNIPVVHNDFTNNLVLLDVLDGDVPEKYFYDCGFELHDPDKRVAATLDINGHDILKRVYNINFKSPTLTACRGGSTHKKVLDGWRCRKLTPNEYRKLQTIPDWYKMDVADSHIYNMCGDGWTIEVIKYILSFMEV